MEANNAETSTTEATVTPITESTKQSVGMFDKPTETKAVNTDTESTTDVSAVEEDKTSTGEESSSEESTESTETESELYYDFDGEEVSASTVKEWKEGNLRQADYTKKSQANAEAKKANEAKTQELDKLTSVMSEAIEKLEANISTEFNKEDMDYLRDNDPSEFLRKQQEQAAKQTDADKAKAGLKALKDQQNKERLATEQQLLLDSLPSWQDAKNREADVKLIESYVESSEMTGEDFQALQSHKLMIMALDAAKYKALQKDTEATKKAVQKAPNVIKAKVKQVSKANKSTVAQRFYGNN